MSFLARYRGATLRAHTRDLRYYLRGVPSAGSSRCWQNGRIWSCTSAGWNSRSCPRRSSAGAAPPSPAARAHRPPGAGPAGGPRWHRRACGRAAAAQPARRAPETAGRRRPAESLARVNGLTQHLSPHTAPDLLHRRVGQRRPAARHAVRPMARRQRHHPALRHGPRQPRPAHLPRGRRLPRRDERQLSRCLARRRWYRFSYQRR